MVYCIHICHDITLFSGLRLGGNYFDCLVQFVVKIIKVDLLCFQILSYQER